MLWNKAVYTLLYLCYLYTFLSSIKHTCYRYISPVGTDAGVVGNLVVVLSLSFINSHVLLMVGWTPGSESIDRKQVMNSRL